MGQRFTNWSLDIGYNHPQDMAFNPHPFRVFGAGMQNCFRLLLKVFDEDIDHLCGGAVQGYKIALHMPNDLPPIWNSYHHISPGKSVHFTIDPNMITTSSDVRKHSPIIRQCYFTSERKLRFFRTYSQRNCELECMANFTLEKCGCVNFSMISENNSSVLFVYTKGVFQSNIYYSDFFCFRIKRHKYLWTSQN